MKIRLTPGIPAVPCPQSASPQIPASEDVQERHERDETEGSPRQLPAARHVGAGGKVDPHQDNSERMQEADQELGELLHDLEPTRTGVSAVTASVPPMRDAMPCQMQAITV